MEDISSFVAHKSSLNQRMCWDQEGVKHHLFILNWSEGKSIVTGLKQKWDFAYLLESVLWQLRQYSVSWFLWYLLVWTYLRTYLKLQIHPTSYVHSKNTQKNTKRERDNFCGSKRVVQAPTPAIAGGWITPSPPHIKLLFFLHYVEYTSLHLVHRWSTSNDGRQSSSCYHSPRRGGKLHWSIKTNSVWNSNQRKRAGRSWGWRVSV